MHARRLAAAIVVIVAVVAGIQLADPRFGSGPDPQPVDFSEPPAEVAADSAAQFEAINYAYQLTFREDIDDPWRQVWEVHVDRSDREFYQVGPDGKEGMLLYGTESTGYYRIDAVTGWQATSRFTYSPETVGQPFLSDRIRRGNATIIHENATHVLIAVDVHPLSTAPHLPGSATLLIEKQTGLLTLAEVTYNTDADPQYLRFRLIDSGIDVSRPENLDYSFRGILLDLLRGPLVRLFQP